MKRSSGFTIVELLIVVVVISILASITVVAYNGIQTRAKNAQILSILNAYDKGLQIYYTQNGTYPEASGENLWCIGEGYGATGDFDAGTCRSLDEHVLATTHATLNTTMATVMSKIAVSPDTIYKGPHPAVPGTLALRGVRV